MKTLEQNLRRKGFDYTQVYRSGDVAIYRQDLNGEFIAFEVFEVRKHHDAEVFGKMIEAHESMPSDESWGQNAYTVSNMEVAMHKLGLIKTAINNRALAAIQTPCN